jgi:hypothetical protein
MCGAGGHRGGGCLDVGEPLGLPGDGLNGRFNVAAGYQAMLRNTNGLTNTALGYRALDPTPPATQTSPSANAGGDLTTGDNNVDLANLGVAGESGKIRIGTTGTQTAAYMAGISGTTISGPTQTVVVNSAVWPRRANCPAHHRLGHPGRGSLGRGRASLSSLRRRRSGLEGAG